VRTLVTGATGFLGRHIVGQLLAEGHHVRALCRNPDSELTSLGVEIVRADLRDRQAAVAACRNVETVFHTAGIAGVWGPWKEYYEANTLATMHVVQGCLAHGVGRLVYTSTPSVTYNGTDQKGVDESTPYAKRWLCHYPHSKALAEQYVLQANGEAGLSTCALRPHLIWGPGDRHLIPGVIERRRAGRLWRVGNGTNLIDMIYVDNAARAHLSAADRLAPGSPVAGRAYFISQGQPVRCWEWIDQILLMAGLGPAPRSLSLTAAWCYGALMEAVWRFFRVPGDPPMTRFLAAQLGTSHYFNICRAQRDFGYAPAMSTAEGMERLAADLAARGLKG
jgi:2-alkyl-3-oxoalkanoate reductase